MSALHILLLPGGGGRLLAGYSPLVQSAADAWGREPCPKDDKRFAAKGRTLQGQPLAILEPLKHLRLVLSPKVSSLFGPQDNFGERGKLGGYLSPFLE